MRSISDQAIREMHLAAQYLAAAGKSFLEHKADDSHTNLAFNQKKASLETWPIDLQGLKLTFNYESFSLAWQSEENELLSFPLDGKSHEEVLSWIRKGTTSLGVPESYQFDLHYDLPYALKQESRFSKPPSDDIVALLNNRNLVHSALETLVSKQKLETGIRIWPHHFDSGGYEVIGAIGIGFGMAIPDTVTDDFYLYCSGYKGHDSLATSSFRPLSMGKWINDGFKGAVLPVTGLDNDQALAFFEEAIANYMNV